MSKVCVIGLDGGTFSVIDFLIGQKRLPNFARLMNEGSSSTLMSTIPPLTPAAWTSFFTGSNPGKTGAVGFFKFRPGTYQLEPMNAGNLRGAPIWSLASSRGKRVCVFNVPVTYPAVPVNGIMISGMDAPSFDDQAIFPLEQKKPFLDAVPDFSISINADTKYLARHSSDPSADYIGLLKSHLGMELRAINYLMGLEDWDLFVGVIRSPDSFQHIFWADAEKVIAGEDVSAEESKRAESVFSCYETIDREIGETWSAWCADRDIIFMSDHGFGRLRSDICLNRVLAEAGLLKFLPRGGRKRFRERMVKRLQAHIPRGTRQKLRKMLGRDMTGQRWHSFVDSLVADIDWSKTRISAIAQHGCLYVNQKGRDPLGQVGSEAERLAVLDEAEEVLSRLMDPEDGMPVVSAFYRKEDIYSGPLMPEMPDMVVNMRDWSYRGIPSTSIELSQESIFRYQSDDCAQLAHTGNHRREGILVMHGPDISAGRPGGAAMVDVAPTIMHLLSLPVPEEWDGAVLAESVKAGAAGQDIAKKVKYDTGAGETGENPLTAEDEEEIRKRLENLGYL
ncbi:MAG: alkaline phosphatase family protein [Thermoleophilia bacterium]